MAKHIFFEHFKGLRATGRVRHPQICTGAINAGIAVLIPGSLAIPRAITGRILKVAIRRFVCALPVATHQRKCQQ